MLRKNKVRRCCMRTVLPIPTDIRDEVLCSAKTKSDGVACGLSCQSQPIFVMKSAKNGCASDASVRRKLMTARLSCHRQTRTRIRQARTETRVRSSPVVMLDPLSQEPPEVLLAQGNHMIETFATKSPDHSFTEGIRLGRSKWRPTHGQAHVFQGTVEVL